MVLFAAAAVALAGFALFGRRSFAATGFVAFAISATVIGMITYLSLYVQNTLGYSPVQGGLRFLPLFLASFTVALLTGRLLGKVPMRVLLGVAMAAAAAGLASMAHLNAMSTWLVLVPGLILAGIGLGITSTSLASAALAAVEPARAGMAAGLTNTLRQVGTATGVAVLGALYASRVTTATGHSRSSCSPANSRTSPSRQRRPQDQLPDALTAVTDRARPTQPQWGVTGKPLRPLDFDGLVLGSETEPEVDRDGSNRTGI